MIRTVNTKKAKLSLTASNLAHIMSRIQILKLIGTWLELRLTYIMQDTHLSQENGWEERL